MSDPWDQQNKTNDQFFNNFQHRFACSKIASDIKDLKTYDLRSFKQLSIAKSELEPFETKEEQIDGTSTVNIKQESALVVPSISTTSSHSKTYYPDVNKFADAQSIPPNNNNNNQQIEVPHFEDPMDSISNSGSVYPSLPIESHSLHSSDLSDSSHNRKHRNGRISIDYKNNNLLTPYTNRVRHQHQYHHLRIPSSHHVYRKNKKTKRRKRKRREICNDSMGYINDYDIYSDSISTASSVISSHISSSSYRSNKSDSKRRRLPRTTTPTNIFKRGSIHSQNIENGGMNIQYVININMKGANVNINGLSNKENDKNKNNNNNNNNKQNDNTKDESGIENVNNNLVINRLERLR